MLKPIFIWQERVLRRIDPEKIKYVESLENYIRIHLTDKTSYLVRSTLANAYQKLPKDIFIKIHRSLVVSIFHLDKIATNELVIGEIVAKPKKETSTEGETILLEEIVPKNETILIDEAIPIGRQYYKPLLKKLIII